MSPLNISLPMKMDDSVRVLGLRLNLMAAVVAVLALVLAVALVAVHLRRRAQAPAGSPARSLAVLALMLGLLVLLPSALIVYTVHCVVEGGCQLWGLLIMVAFVAYIAVTLLKRGAVAAMLSNLVARRRGLARAASRAASAIKA